MTPAISTALAKAVAPFALLAFMTALAYARWLIIKWLPESKFKRLLLKDV